MIIPLKYLPRDCQTAGDYVYIRNDCDSYILSCDRGSDKKNEANPFTGDFCYLLFFQFRK